VLLSIEPGSDVPLYLQLRNQIVDALVRGELVEGDRLPSVRQLAIDLGINLHTVNKAYKTLEREGYLRIHGRRGARVAAPLTYTTSYLEQLQEALARLSIEARSQGIGPELFQATVDRALAAGIQTVPRTSTVPPSQAPTSRPSRVQTPTRKDDR
jgi:DNA-binding transcriptional regulator YhcF (GntR family)